MYDYAWFGVAFTGDLVIGLENITLTEALQTFIDPQETATLTFYKDPDLERQDTNETLEGYTRFISIRVDQIDNTINVSLGREYAQ